MPFIIIVVIAIAYVAAVHFITKGEPKIDPATSDAIAFHRNEVLAEARKLVSFNWADKSPEGIKAGDDLGDRLLEAARRLVDAEKKVVR
jgi:hypothetical protein